MAVLCSSSASAQQKLDTVKVSAEAVTYISPSLRGFEERRLKGHGKYLSEAELRKNDNERFASVLLKIGGLRTIQYGMTTVAASTRTAGSGRAGAMSSFSRRPCYVAVFVDGMMVYNGEGGGTATGGQQPPPDIERIQVKELGGVEFYAGGASLPAQFSQIRGADCGTLLLWTRER